MTKATMKSFNEDHEGTDDLEEDAAAEKLALTTSTPLHPITSPAYFTDEPELQRMGSLSEEEEFALLPDDARRIKRLSKKPDIDHLPNGTIITEDGQELALFEVGDRIVAERYTTLLPGTPWLDTRTYFVQEIDDETGAVRCLDEEQGHRAYVGFKDPFTRIKLAVRGINPFKKAKKIRLTAEGETTGAGAEKTRGRQKGTKNRPKEVVAAEKKERAERMEKRAKKRLAKSKGNRR